MKKLLSLGCAALLAGAMTTVGIGCSGDAEKICKQAAEKYGKCVEKTLGPEMAKTVRAKEKEGIAACKKDKKTVKMYKKCLPAKGCDKFMKCIQDYAATHGP